MITEYHQRETLAHHPDLFRGQPVKALTAFRELLLGVVALHNAGVVHRDIKPANILVADDDRLVLGDFGIVFVENSGRLTETFEKVGTTDWMAPWARHSGPIDNVKANFDVFPLAKVLWSMLSGQPVLPFWYFNSDTDANRRYDLTKLFPKMSAMRLVNQQILSAAIVEQEKDCLASAGALLNRVDEVLETLGSEGQVIGNSDMRCLVCGRGRYRLRWVKQHEHLRMLPVARLPQPNQSPQFHQVFAGDNWITVRVHSCDHCGHVALFQFPDQLAPPAWQ
jgi:serine/threonine protein kinase